MWLRVTNWGRNGIGEGVHETRLVVSRGTKGSEY